MRNALIDKSHQNRANRSAPTCCQPWQSFSFKNNYALFFLCDRRHTRAMVTLAIEFPQINYRGLHVSRKVWELKIDHSCLIPPELPAFFNLISFFFLYPPETRRGKLDFSDRMVELFSGFSHRIEFTFELPVKNVLKYLDIELKFRPNPACWSYEPRQKRGPAVLIHDGSI